MSSCYVGYKTAKTGQIIPIFNDGKPSCSLYNPQRDAEQFCSLLEKGTTLITGYASGIHIKKALEQFPTNKIIVVEKNIASIEYLQNDLNIQIHENIILCTIDTIEKVLLENYYPPKDGNFQLIPLRSWTDANLEDFLLLKKKTQHALQLISQDISVQAHFGKIWQHNIIQNLKLCGEINNKKIVDFYTTKFPTHKTAYIAGAGPSLENDYELLKTNAENYFIIATDTAFHALSENNIDCDVVISVDAQSISRSHFMCKRDSKTLFAFDLCANPTPIKKIISTNPILFFKSNHPLCTYANNFAKKDSGIDYFPTIESTGGTVTLAALNFATLAKFSKIKTGGCDFSYSKGKTYAKGIYMDPIFNSQSTKLNTTENNYAKILYRTPLIPISNNSFTTTVLQTYKEAYENFIKNLQEKDEHKIDYKVTFKQESFPYKSFFNTYKKVLNILLNEGEVAENTELTTLLPFLTWMSYKNRKSDENYKNLLKTTIQSIHLML